jgi:hypothetical protein
MFYLDSEELFRLLSGDIVTLKEYGGMFSSIAIIGVGKSAASEALIAKVAVREWREKHA